MSVDWHESGSPQAMREGRNANGLKVPGGDPEDVSVVIDPPARQNEASESH